MAAAQQAMSIIGNNIANINSTAYREQSAIFGELYNQALAGGVGPTKTLGARNPITMGSGVTLLGEQVNTAQGSITNTGNPTDMAINGHGFFVLDNGNGSQGFTRNGAFSLSADGSLVSSGGQRVMGYMAKNGVLPVAGAGTLQDIILPMTALSPPAATTTASLSGNLAAGATAPVVVQGTVYDAQGNAITLQITFTPPTSSGGPWTWAVTGPSAATGSGTVTFSPSGTYASTSGGPITVPGANGASTITITPDVSALTQYAASTSVDMSTQNGYPAGQPLSISVSQSGVVQVQYSNGKITPVAQVAIATFANSQGLSGGTAGVYRQSAASGLPNIGPANSGGRGSIAPDSLEGSNVSLTQQFSQLIAVQHDYAANAQAISAESLMLNALTAVQV